MENFENPNFLKKKYDLHNAPETEVAAKRTEKRTGEKVSQNPEAQIQNYLDRFREIIERKEPAKRERGIEALKHILHEKFVIKEEEIPESYFESQRRIAREQGHGDIEITDEMREQLTEVIISDQKSSLDQWVTIFHPVMPPILIGLNIILSEVFWEWVNMTKKRSNLRKDQKAR